MPTQKPATPCQPKTIYLKIAPSADAPPDWDALPAQPVNITVASNNSFDIQEKGNEKAWHLSKSLGGRPVSWQGRAGNAAIVRYPFNFEAPTYGWPGHEWFGGYTTADTRHLYKVRAWPLPYEGHPGQRWAVQVKHGDGVGTEGIVVAQWDGFFTPYGLSPSDASRVIGSILLALIQVGHVGETMPEDQFTDAAWCVAHMTNLATFVESHDGGITALCTGGCYWPYPSEFHPFHQPQTPLDAWREAFQVRGCHRPYRGRDLFEDKYKRRGNYGRWFEFDDETATGRTIYCSLADAKKKVHGLRG